MKTDKNHIPLLHCCTVFSEITSQDYVLQFSKSVFVKHIVKFPS